MKDKNRSIFLELSAELTGYSPIELEGTGLVDQYYSIVCKDIGSNLPEVLFSAASRACTLRGEARARAIQVDVVASPILWPVCQSIIVLWYQGVWTRMSDYWYKNLAGIEAPPSYPNPGVATGGNFVPSASAYTEQLSYRAAGAHPPGAHPTGFGSWAIAPVFGDFVNDKIDS